MALCIIPFIHFFHRLFHFRFSCFIQTLISIFTGSKERPDTQCDSLLSYFMQENVWLPQDRLKAAEEITSETFIKRAKKALIRRRVTSHIHGDLTQEAALALYDQSMAILGPNEGDINENCSEAWFYLNIFHEFMFAQCLVLGDTENMCYHSSIFQSLILVQLTSPHCT